MSETLTKWVYSFGAGHNEGSASMRDLLGGKGANLAEMAGIGLPVPPGFTITTEVCTAFYDSGRNYPAELKDQVRAALALVEDAVGLKFGDREERDIADIYALPADEVLRRSFTDPARFVPDYATLDDAELQAIAHDREATALYGWKPYMHNPALLHWLHRVSVPSLVLWGEADGIVAPAYGEKLATALPSARFERIPGTAHYPQIEQPEAVANHIARFAQENRP